MFDQHTREKYASQLEISADKLGISLSQEQVSLLVDYLGLLTKWNKAFNLTAVRNPDDMLYRHIVDSLSIAPYIKGSRIIDVGTGPGLPGIPMAILNPDIRFVLLDSNVKKTRFLTQCLIELGIKNAEVFHGRVEQAKFGNSFDQILSRAFTAADNMVEICKHLLSDNGLFLAMKGLEPLDELGSMDKAYQVKQTIKLDVPGCDGQRHLIIIEKKTA